MNLSDFYNDIIIGGIILIVGVVANGYLKSIYKGIRNLELDFTEITTKVNNLQETSSNCEEMMNSIRTRDYANRRSDTIIKDAYAYVENEDIHVLHLIGTLGRETSVCIDWMNNHISDTNENEIRGRFEVSGRIIRLSLLQMEKPYYQKVQPQLRKLFNQFVIDVVNMINTHTTNSKFLKYLALTEIMLHKSLEIIINERTIYNLKQKENEK